MYVINDNVIIYKYFYYFIVLMNINYISLKMKYFIQKL